jgi:hypothetical protein
MNVDQIYLAAKDRGLVSSKRCFSRSFLGRASNYASDTGLSHCSAGALTNLCRHLGDIGQADLLAMAFQLLLDAEAPDGSEREVQP